jgi:pimeloyl-ACP methyl ester carboxylesterase
VELPERPGAREAAYRFVSLAIERKEQHERQLAETRRQESENSYTRRLLSHQERLSQSPSLSRHHGRPDGVCRLAVAAAKNGGQASLLCGVSPNALGAASGRSRFASCCWSPDGGLEHIPDAAVRGLRAPTLIITGDRDVARLEHAVDLSRLFPDARLLVLPSGHDYLGEASSAAADTGYAEIAARLLERFCRFSPAHAE